MKNCQEYNIPVHRLKRYAIENYLSILALREVFKGQISQTLTQLNPHTKLEDQINMNVKNNLRKIVSKMDLAEIENTDLYEFFEKVELLCSKKTKDTTTGQPYEMLTSVGGTRQPVIENEW